MRIQVDVEGVLADPHTPFLKLLNERKGTDFRYEDIRKYDCWKALGLTEKEFFRLLDEVWAKWWTVPPSIPNVSEAMEKLNRLGTVDIVTKRNSSTAPYVKTWLFAKGIRYRRFIQIGLKRNKAELGYDVYLEDSPIEATAIARKGAVCLLIDQPWNRSLTETRNIIRVPSIAESTVIKHLEPLSKPSRNSFSHTEKEF